MGSMGARKGFWSACALCVLVVCAASVSWAAQAKVDAAVTLRDKYAVLGEQLKRNPFGRPLVLESTDSSKRVTGEIYATVDYPFAETSAGLSDPGHWCDVILLHTNTKYCRAASAPSGATLSVFIGKKTQQELSSASRLDFAYRVAAVSADYFDIALDARDGPMGTSDYRIQLEALALPNAKTFLHLTYSYGFNFAGRIALQTYLKTLGRDKVGFTATGQLSDGRPDYIGGMRGLVERNAMRYYLAIDAFLESARGAPAARFERRLQSWFTATEQYPRQLHDIDRSEYLEMKRAENLRQQAASADDG